MLRIQRNDLQVLEEAARFCAVGVLNTAIDFGLYFLLSRWIGWIVAAKSLSYCAGLINSFFLNRTWTFRSKVKIQRSLPAFTAANLVGLLINAGIMHLTFSLLDFPELLCLGLATTASLGWNFFASKMLVFHKG